MTLGLVFSPNQFISFGFVRLYEGLKKTVWQQVKISVWAIISVIFVKNRIKLFIISFNEPIISFNEPIISFNESIISFNEPIISFNEPIISFNEPIISFNEPIISFNEPIISFNEPIISFNVFTKKTKKEAIENDCPLKMRFY